MGEPIGFDPTKEDYEDVLRAAREAVIPSIHYQEIKEFEVHGKRIFALEVPQDVDQVYSTSDGRYLVRENFENVRVDWRKLYQLMAKMERVSFEELPCEGAFFEDIDFEKVRVYLRVREERIGSKIDIPKEKGKITNRVYRDRGGFKAGRCRSINAICFRERI
jgi:predicted HTH transcriptional regulator